MNIDLGLDTLRRADSLNGSMAYEGYVVYNDLKQVVAKLRA